MTSSESKFKFEPKDIIICVFCGLAFVATIVFIILVSYPSSTTHYRGWNRRPTNHSTGVPLDLTQQEIADMERANMQIPDFTKETVAIMESNIHEWNVTCPYCNKYIPVGELRCGIFRHAYKLNQHASFIEVMKWKLRYNETFDLFCGGPFKIIDFNPPRPNKKRVVQCSYNE